MKKYICLLSGLTLAASAAYAQPTSEPAAPAADDAAAEAAAPAEEAADAAAPAAEAAAPSAGAAAAVTVEVSEADIDSFAKATVKLQEIAADTSIAADARQTAMRAAVAEAGLDPAKYNAIGRAAQADATLRAKVQTAMSKYAVPRTDG